MSDNKLKKQKKVGSKARELLLEQQLNQSPSKLLTDSQTSKVEASKQKINSARSHYAYNKPLIPPVRGGYCSQYAYNNPLIQIIRGGYLSHYVYNKLLILLVKGGYCSQYVYNKLLIT